MTFNLRRYDDLVSTGSSNTEPLTGAQDDRPPQDRSIWSLHERYVPRGCFATERWPSLSTHALCPTGDIYEGETGEGKLNGRGVYTWANGMCLAVPVGLNASLEHMDTCMHSALQEPGMRASLRTGTGMAEAFRPRPVVCVI